MKAFQQTDAPFGNWELVEASEANRMYEVDPKSIRFASSIEELTRDLNADLPKGYIWREPDYGKRGRRLMFDTTDDWTLECGKKLASLFPGESVHVAEWTHGKKVVDASFILEGTCIKKDPGHAKRLAKAQKRREGYISVYSVWNLAHEIKEYARVKVGISVLLFGWRYWRVTTTENYRCAMAILKKIGDGYNYRNEHWYKKFFIEHRWKRRSPKLSDDAEKWLLTEFRAAKRKYGKLVKERLKDLR